MDTIFSPPVTALAFDASVPAIGAESFGERLRLLIGDISVRHFARLCGMSESAVRQYLTGRSEPNMSALTGIARAAGVRIDWLVTGNGPIRLDTVDTSSAGYLTVRCANKDYIRLSRQDIPAHHLNSGTQNLITEDTLMFQADWLRKELGADPSALLLVSSRDDSMEPTISQGDLLLVDMSQKVSNDALYAILFNNMLMVKRIQLLLHDKMHLQIISDNPAYKTQILPADTDAIQIVGRVVWGGHRR